MNVTLLFLVVPWLKALGKTSVITNGPFADRNLGLCEEGEGDHIIDEEEVVLGRRNSVNFSGQLFSRGHPLGVTGTADIHKAGVHFREETERRQVFGVRNGLTNAIGLDSGCGIHIL